MMIHTLLHTSKPIILFMKLGPLTITAVTIISVLSFTSFGRDKAIDNKTQVSKENQNSNTSTTSTSASPQKFTFDDYSKKDVNDKKSNIRYKDFPNQRMYYYKVQQGGKAKAHSHDTDQTGYVVKGEGQVEFFGPTKFTVNLKEGDSFFIPRLLQHELTALTNLELVAFNPGTTANESSKFTH